MNTTLIRQNHPPILEEQPRQVRRVGLLDRIALHIGIALIKWGRRPAQLATRERRANRVEQQLARLARERDTERMMRLITPLR
jgi:hypothetical protein